MDAQPLPPTTRRSGPHRTRIALWVVLLLSWLVLLPMLWNAFSTVPSMERLSQSRMVEIPTLRTVGLLVGRSTIEAAILLALLAPWIPRHYLTRLWLAAVGLGAWFLATTPLGLTRMSWIHRRWLALMWVTLVVAALVGSAVGMRSRVGRDGAG